MDGYERCDDSHIHTELGSRSPLSSLRPSRCSACRRPSSRSPRRTQITPECSLLSAVAAAPVRCLPASADGRTPSAQHHLRHPGDALPRRDRADGSHPAGLRGRAGAALPRAPEAQDQLLPQVPRGRRPRVRARRAAINNNNGALLTRPRARLARWCGRYSRRVCAGCARAGPQVA
jgi:hypothetical protein